MALFLIIISILCWAAALLLLFRRPFYAPALSYIGLFLISLAKEQGYPLLPLNSTILVGWLCMTIVVMLATMMQPEPVRNAANGVAYMTVGALVGMAVGLLGFTFSSQIAMLYGIMIVATAAGVFFGFMLYSRTPKGSGLGLASGNFFKYLLAKGFPVAITVMMIGVVLTLVLALHGM